MQNQNSTKVILSKDTLWSYVNAWTPKAIGDNATPKYSVSCIIKKDSPDVDKVKAAIRLAYEEGESKLKGTSKSVPAFEAIKNPLRDGDLERPGDPAYAGCYFINANAKDAPGIIDKNKQPIIDHSEIYSGVKGRVSITFFAFNNSGNRGIACHLNNLQKWEDGEPLGSKASAEADFSDTDDDFLF